MPILRKCSKIMERLDKAYRRYKFEVKIEFDVERRNRYGKLLSYVYLSDGRILNDESVKVGYANILRVPPNVKYQERFLKAYREARHNKRILWKG